METSNNHHSSLSIISLVAVEFETRSKKRRFKVMASSSPAAGGVADAAPISSAALFHFGSGLPELGPIVSPSPQPTRLVCTATDEVLVANGKRVLIYNVRDDEVRSQARLPDDGNVSKMSFAAPHLVATVTAHPPNALGNFQSICAQEGRAYAVDSLGSVCYVSKLNDVWVCEKIAAGCAESFSSGWAGVAPISTSQISTCHYLTKALSWVDIEATKVTRTSQFSSNPTAICSLRGSNIGVAATTSSAEIVATEGNFVSAWDSRMQENGNSRGNISSLFYPRSIIYCLVMASRMLHAHEWRAGSAVGGDERVPIAAALHGYVYSELIPIN